MDGEAGDEAAGGGSWRGEAGGEAVRAEIVEVTDEERVRSWAATGLSPLAAGCVSRRGEASERSGTGRAGCGHGCGDAFATAAEAASLLAVLPLPLPLLVEVASIVGTAAVVTAATGRGVTVASAQPSAAPSAPLPVSILSPPAAASSPRTSSPALSPPAAACPCESGSNEALDAVREMASRAPRMAATDAERASAWRGDSLLLLLILLPPLAPRSWPPQEFPRPSARPVPLCSAGAGHVLEAVWGVAAPPAPVGNALEDSGSGAAA